MESKGGLSASKRKSALCVGCNLAARLELKLFTGTRTSACTVLVDHGRGRTAVRESQRKQNCLTSWDSCGSDGACNWFGCVCFRVLRQSSCSGTHSRCE
jgi:hypothetical protein